MPLTGVAPIEASIDIAASPAAVWAVVSDLRNMPRWSPQGVKVFQRGATGVGARFLNINRRGPLVWPTRSQIVRFTPEQEIAWRVKDNLTVWSIGLAPNADGGTTVTQRREAPQGISDISVSLTKLAFGGVDSFGAELQRDMQTTLGLIKTEIEGGA